VAALALGFGQDSTEGNPDGLGRHWLKVPVSGTDGTEQFEDWVYDPDHRQLYKAANGERPVEMVITAESLGLEPEAELIGKDPYGRYWFKIHGGEKRMYDAKKRELYRAFQGTDGKTTLEKIASPGLDPSYS
jgi:hypothetical protein